MCALIVIKGRFDDCHASSTLNVVPLLAHHTLLTMQEINLWLDSYDDIYSDFDSRNYRKRRISEDFIEELKLDLQRRKDPVDRLTLSLPTDKRKGVIEKDVLQNMAEQLRERHHSLKQTLRQRSKKNVIMVAAGILLAVVNATIVSRPASYPLTLLRMLSEPASWFLIWNGVDFLVYGYRSISKETEFYKTLSHLNIQFKNT